jgi:hypothetical protein
LEVSLKLYQSGTGEEIKSSARGADLPVFENCVWYAGKNRNFLWLLYQFEKGLLQRE